MTYENNTVLKPHEYAEELNADYWASRTLEKQLDGLRIEKSDNKEALFNEVRSMMDIFCRNPCHHLDGHSHPPFGYRVEYLFSNPALRKKLGCDAYASGAPVNFCSAMPEL